MLTKDKRMTFLIPAMVPLMFQLLVMAQSYFKKAVCKVLVSIVEHLSYNDIQDLNTDIAFESDNNSGFLATSSHKSPYLTAEPAPSRMIILPSIQSTNLLR